jgi:hypothetical protein
MQPTYVCYTLAWKLILDRKTIGKVTEEDLVIAPSDYWVESLQADVQNMPQTKIIVTSELDLVTVKVYERPRGNLEVFFNSTRTSVENQLHK